MNHSLDRGSRGHRGANSFVPWGARRVCLRVSLSCTPEQSRSRNRVHQWASEAKDTSELPVYRLGSFGGES